MATDPLNNIEDKVRDIKSKSLMARLKQLFSSEAVVRNIGGKKLKIKDTENLMYTSDKSGYNDRFNRVRSTGYNAYTRDFSLSYQSARVDLFRDYDTMDQDPIIAAALDIYADECLTVNEMGHLITVISPDQNIRDSLDNLFYDVLNINHNLWSWVRSCCKYGDSFLKIYINPEFGVYFVEPISSYNVERIENSDPKNRAYVKFQVRPTDTTQMETLEFFEVAHFRLISDGNFLPYGRCLRGSTKIWTPTGYKEIKDIIPGDDVYSFDTNSKSLRKTKVLKQIMSGIKDIYEIKTTHRTLYATYEHPILTNQWEYKQIKNLTLSDYLILPIINNNENGEIPDLSLNESELNPKTVKIEKSNLNDNIDKFVRFFGFMLGDGWLDKSNKTVCFSIGDRLDKSKKHIDFLNLLGVSYRLTNGLESDSSCIIHSVYLYKLLEKLGFKTGTENKEIPTWVWSLPLNVRKEIILGFADADGADLEIEKSYQIGTINERLIIDLRELSMNVGFSTTKIWKTECDSGKLMNLFTFRTSSRDLIKQSENYSIEKIRSIKKLDQKEEVFDIQVESNFSNFVADGLVVHNSMIEPARRCWKQLSLMEDAMLIHRIMRAPEKRIFKIDVGNVPPNEIDSYVEKMTSKIKKVPYIDEKTGDYNLRFNLMNMVEDFIMPVRGSDSGTSIDPLPGMEWTGTEDIEYIRNKMMAALKIPKAFLSYDEGVGGKATLATMDVRFAKTIQRLQKVIVSELQKIAIAHLYTKGFRDESLVNFELQLTNPSTIFEREKVEMWGEKVEVARQMISEVKLFSRPFIYKHLFNMSEDDIKELDDQIVEDNKRSFRLKSIEEEGVDPAAPQKKINPNNPEGGDLGGPEGDLGGLGSGGPGEDLPGGPEDKSEPSGGPGGPELPPPPTAGSGGPVKESTFTTAKDGKRYDYPDYERSSQEGKKDSRDYPFGEDPLGNKENERDSSKSDRSIIPVIKKKTTLNLESSSMLTSLGSFLSSKTVENEKQQLIKEAENNKSMLDESNLILD